MTRVSFVTAALLLPAMFGCSTAFACSLQDLEISDAKSEKLGIFTENGKFERTTEPGKVLPARVVACNESLGLVLIAKADGSKVWIDPIEVRLPSAKPSGNACVAASKTKENNSRVLALVAGPHKLTPCSPNK
jgi:hypothetical protein